MRNADAVERVQADLVVKGCLANKKADVIERPQAFHHVGLLANEPPGMAELPFIQSSDDSYSISIRTSTPWQPDSGLNTGCKRCTAEPVAAAERGDFSLFTENGAYITNL